MPLTGSRGGDMFSLLAFDIGGTRIKSAVVAGDDVLDLSVRATPADMHTALAAAEEAGRQLLAGHSCHAVAACVPGLVDEFGTIRSLPGKLAGAEGMDLRSLLESTFELQATVVNDAIAYGAGEATLGAGRGHRRVVVMTIGTGVGVTVLEGGRQVGGGLFGGGIIGGHIPIADAEEGRLDSNGRPDTIEALCCAARLVDYSADAGGAAATTEDVFAQYRTGVPAAVAGIERYRAHLARAVVALAHAHAPDVVVIGGGPIVPGGPLLEGLEDTVNSRLYGSYTVKVEPAMAGDGAALLGLSRLARAVLRP